MRWRAVSDSHRAPPRTTRTVRTMTIARSARVRSAARVVLGGALIIAGLGHLTFARNDFQAQVPDWVGIDKNVVVILSGLVEIVARFGVDRRTTPPLPARPRSRPLLHRRVPGQHQSVHRRPRCVRLELRYCETQPPVLPARACRLGLVVHERVCPLPRGAGELEMSRKPQRDHIGRRSCKHPQPVTQ